MKKQLQKGFTLIELIIVIIILGILAVTAAPRFLDLSTDARVSAMQGILGAVRASSQITHAALLVRSGSVAIEGVDVQTDPDPTTTAGSDVIAPFTYAHAEDICDLIGLTTTDGAAGELGTDDPSDSLTCTTTATAVTIQDTAATTPAQCQIVYTEASNANTPPTIIPTLTAC